MNLQKIKNIDKENLFKWHSSLKEWNLKNLEWFLVKDGFYFNEYGKVNTNNIMTEFIKKNKKKWQFLHDIIKKWDISLNSTWHITCASWLWFTLDKISFISLWYRKKIQMIEIKTNDGYSITVTPNKKILTNEWYIEAFKLRKGIELIGIMWSSYNWFKNWGLKKEYIDIYNILIEINELISKAWNKEIKIKDLSKDIREYLNILGIQTSNKIITKAEIDILLKALEWKNNKQDIDILLDDTNNKNLFLRNIETVKEVIIEDAYIWSIISKLANNCIINNIILEK